MKYLLLGLVILPLLIISCTTDAIDITESIDSEISGKKSKKTARLVENLTPENLENIYDYAGKLHNDLLNVYLAGNYPYNTIAAISQEIETIAALNSDTVFLNLKTNQPNTIEDVQEILDNPQAKLEEVIANSSMTNAAKGSLFSFMSDTLLWENEEYGVIYPSITSYESSVIDNTQFSSEDKRIILTTSSIVRYSLYYAKERKDKDWDSSVGNIVGGMIGAIANLSTAVSRSLVTGIVIHNLGAD